VNAPFPFGFAPATAWYLTLYVLTLVLHVLFMNYSLAGSGWVALHAFRQGSALARPDDRPRSVTGILVDWLPAMLSGAITAGVAPLLFLQILYRQSFYTANLLLFHRWMAILPVLIVGFYALYLLRGAWLRQRGSLATAVMGIVPLLCLAFTGWAWTENHLLGLREPGQWAEAYEQGRVFHSDWRLVPRLFLWSCGAVPTFAAVIGWQVAWYQSQGDSVQPEARLLATSAWGGMGLAVLSAVGYAMVGGEPVRSAIFGALAWPYLGMATLGMALQVAGWTFMWRADAITVRWLSLVSAGLTLTLVGIAVCREAIRLTALGPERLEGLFAQHAHAAQVSGQTLFFVFLAVNTLLIAWCFWLVRRDKRPDEKRPADLRSKGRS
jgi:hypothetical protein